MRIIYVINERVGSKGANYKPARIKGRRIGVNSAVWVRPARSVDGATIKIDAPDIRTVADPFRLSRTSQTCKTDHPLK